MTADTTTYLIRVKGHLDAASTEILVNCSLGVVVLAAVPWRYVCQRYVRASGDARTS